MENLHAPLFHVLQLTVKCKNCVNALSTKYTPHTDIPPPLYTRTRTRTRTRTHTHTHTAVVSSFLFVPVWGMCTTRITLWRFGDKGARWRATYHKNYLFHHNCPFRITTSAWKLRIAQHRSAWLHYKTHPPNKRCIVRNKTLYLTNEYLLNSEVSLTRGLCSV